MPQFVFILKYPLNNDPVAEPFDVNIFRTDQVIVWKNIVPDTQWSTRRPIPIVFDQAWFDAGGTTPTQLEGPDGAPLWTATGPGPSPLAITYVYEVYLEPINGGEEIHVTRRRKLPTGDEILVDPDVWNQPQP